MILITGGIGSGKSVVSRILRLKGHFVFDCDFEAKKIMQSSPNVKNFIVSQCGEDCIDSTGEVVRHRLRQVIFSSPSLRDELNKIVHSLVREAIVGEINRWGNEMFVESAIPSTGGLLPFASEVWLVEAPQHLRKERACMRSNLSDEEFLAILRSQDNEMNDVQASALTVRTILNDGSDSLMSQLYSLFPKI